MAEHLAWYRSWEDVRPEDLEQVTKLLAAGTLSVPSGGVLARFEKRFAQFAGTRHAVAFHNGTGALYAALRACGAGPGKDVLVCDYGFHGVAAAVVATGARMVPVDFRPDTLAMDPEDLKRARTPASVAVLVHNPWGVPADLKALREACPDLKLVSDASHAHGATLEEKPLGAWADVTCWSMGHQKLISGGELGCAATDDPALRDRMLVLGHVNRVPGDLLTGEWQGNAVGLKMRPHPVALLLAQGQIKRYDEKVARLRETCGALEEALRACGLRPQAGPPGARRVWWRIVLHVGGLETAEVEAALRLAGAPVEANHYWPPLQEQALFAWPGHEPLVLRRDCPRVRETAPGLVTLPAPVQLPDEVMARFLEDAAREIGRLRKDLVPTTGGKEPAVGWANGG